MAKHRDNAVGQEGPGEPPQHLVNAARTLERILAAEDPDHVYTVEILPPKEDD
ncbi:MAG: hypothetical protein WD810_06525 [Solirubrobacterales bacterium]